MKHIIVGATCYAIAIWLAIAVVHLAPFTLTTFMLILVGYERLKEGAAIMKGKTIKNVISGTVEYEYHNKRKSRY